MNVSKKSEIIKTDIVVVGGGGSGLSAALAAAEKGAKCLVLEKRGKVGGNTVFAEGFFAAESPAQKRMMIDARRDELFQIAMDYCHWTLNPRIIRAFIDKSGDTVRWLEEKGVRFRLPPMYPNQVPLVWHCPDKDGKKGGKFVVETLLKECQKIGVKLLCGTAAKKILVSKTGAVTGVVATANKAEITINARCVIIATGGYAGNKRLMRKYCPEYTEKIFCHGLPHVGDGLKMVMQIGGATEGLGIIQTGGPFVGAKAYEATNVSGIAGEPLTMWVNKRGERFTNEVITFQPFECANAILRQPEKIIFSLFDDAIKRHILQYGMEKGMGLGGGYPVHIKDLGKDLQKQVDEGKVKIANTWDEIAHYIGANPEILRATINEYNDCCDREYDNIFVKDRRYLRAIRTSPFYAIECHIGMLGTIGGIKINHNMQVLNQLGSAITGLYAVGVDTGGWEDKTYNVRLSGSTFGFALDSGRIAGENAAEQLLTSKL